MARKREMRVDIANPQTKEKLNYIISQHPDRSIQEILDLAIDGLFRAEAEQIQLRLQQLLENQEETHGTSSEAQGS